MKVKVYQVQAKRIGRINLTEDYRCEKVNCTYRGGLIKRSEPKIYKIAEAEISEQEDNVICETMWNMCNISCWDETRADWAGQNCKFEKGEIHFTTDFEGYCNSDIIVEIGTKLYRAATIGFEEETSLDSAANYIKTHYWGIEKVGRDNMAYDEYMSTHK